MLRQTVEVKGIQGNIKGGRTSKGRKTEEGGEKGL